MQYTKAVEACDCATQGQLAFGAMPPKPLSPKPKVHTWFTPERILRDRHVTAKVHTWFTPERIANYRYGQAADLTWRSKRERGATGADEGLDK